MKALLITKTEAFQHDAKPQAVAAVKRLARERGFELVVDPEGDKLLAPDIEAYKLVIFALTTGNILSQEQKRALQQHISTGGGFVGIHSATDTEHEWKWYRKLMGRMFYIHPEIQSAEVQVIDREFPATVNLPDRFYLTEEWYEFGPEHSVSLQYTLAVNENSYEAASDWGDKKSQGMGSFHPISWHQEYQGGRMFYTALGHCKEVYQNQLFLDHLWGGIKWAASIES